jgi:exonuclease III
MRIVSWNMDHWLRSAALRERAWQFLREQVRPDIALVQEAVPPSGLSAVFRADGMLDERRSPARQLGWGSAVVSLGPGIKAIDHARSPFHREPVPLLRTLPGCVAIASLEGDDPLVVISAYGVIDRGYASETVHRILCDITPLVDERRGRGIVLAGDLNITTQWSDKHRRFLRGRYKECFRRDSNLFDRFSALGFHNLVRRSDDSVLPDCDCTLGSACRHVQTQRHPRSPFPWQNDYVFVTSDLLDRAPKITVRDEEDAWALSGHCPIVLDLN